jgi:hypothetical protein
MLSVDFGNTYTKVALRLDFDARGELLTDASLKWDDINACVPTLAACYEGDGKATWHYGTDVMKFRDNTPKLKVYRNWKPRFFQEPGAKLLATPVSRQMGVAVGWPSQGPPRGVTAEAWETMKRALAPDQVAKLWTELGGRAENGAPEETDLEHKHIGLGFFRWLREFFDPVCRRRLGCPASEVPARVSLPSFGAMEGAKLLLTHILSEAGWALDERAPVLPEPLANAIGTFTEGLNVTHGNGNGPHFGQMFHQTGLLARIRDAILYNGPKTAWVLIVDLGGYTADFAMVGLELEDIHTRFDGQMEGKPRLAHDSKAIGVTDLDNRLKEQLPEAKQKALNDIIAAPDQQRLESFHKNCFGFLGHHSVKNIKIGDSPREKATIRDVVARFAEDVADDAEAFLDTYQYERIDDLILTGGGTMIPAVQEALCKRLSRYGIRKVHHYASERDKLVASIPSHPLKMVLVRGATAIGGASIYFDCAQE